MNVIAEWIEEGRESLEVPEFKYVSRFCLSDNFVQIHLGKLERIFSKNWQFYLEVHIVIGIEMGAHSGIPSVFIHIDVFILCISGCCFFDSRKPKLMKVF